ncbi:hypothetical protein DI035_15565, partial [Legionella pneumophila]
RCDPGGPVQCEGFAWGDDHVRGAGGPVAGRGAAGGGGMRSGRRRSAGPIPPGAVTGAGESGRRGPPLFAAGPGVAAHPVAPRRALGGGRTRGRRTGASGAGGDQRCPGVGTASVGRQARHRGDRRLRA